MPDITDEFTYYETPEGIIIPKSMINDIVIKIASEEESAEIDVYKIEQEKIREEKEIEKKRLKEEKKQKEKELNEKDQLRLFD